MSATTSPFEAYGRVLGALNAGLTRALSEMAVGFQTGMDAGLRRSHEFAAKLVEAQARRERIAAFDVDAERERLADLGRHIAAERAKHGIEAHR